MANNPRRIYWDACVWIAMIQREKIQVGASDRDTLCRAVIVEAKSSKIEILTSTLSLAEVCKSQQVRATADDELSAYFENDYILLMNVDRMVGEHARQLMTTGSSGLKPADAIHVASAVLGQASEMHTFDDKMLKLDGRISRLDGGKLKICPPDTGLSPSLFD